MFRAATSHVDVPCPTWDELATYGHYGETVTAARYKPSPASEQSLNRLPS